MRSVRIPKWTTTWPTVIRWTPVIAVWLVIVLHESGVIQNLTVPMIMVLAVNFLCGFMETRISKKGGSRHVR